MCDTQTLVANKSLVIWRFSSNLAYFCISNSPLPLCPKRANRTWKSLPYFQKRFPILFLQTHISQEKIFCQVSLPFHSGSVEAAQRLQHSHSTHSPQWSSGAQRRCDFTTRRGIFLHSARLMQAEYSKRMFCSSIQYKRIVDVMITYTILSISFFKTSDYQHSSPQSTAQAPGSSRMLKGLARCCSSQIALWKVKANNPSKNNLPGCLNCIYSVLPHSSNAFSVKDSSSSAAYAASVTQAL